MFNEFIEELKKLKNTKMAVVSSGSNLYVEKMSRNTGLNFDYILGAEDHHSKQYKVEYVAEKWKIDVKDAYYFTDTKTDVLELENLMDKSKIIGCSWGWHGFDRLKEVLPENQILKNFSDIHKIFK